RASLLVTGGLGRVGHGRSEGDRTDDDDGGPRPDHEPALPAATGPDHASARRGEDDDGDEQAVAPAVAGLVARAAIGVPSHQLPPAREGDTRQDTAMPGAIRSSRDPRHRVLVGLTWPIVARRRGGTGNRPTSRLEA